MPFDVAGARQAGYSDDDIADFLAAQSGFDLAGATKAGYSASEVIGFLAAAGARPARGPAPPDDDPLTRPLAPEPSTPGSANPTFTVSRPKVGSVFDEQRVEPEFNPQPAQRLSRRAAAEASPLPDDPRATAPKAGKARPMTLEPASRTAGDVAGDVAAASLKIGPTALKTLAQIYSMGTGGAVG